MDGFVDKCKFFSFWEYHADFYLLYFTTDWQRMFGVCRSKYMLQRFLIEDVLKHGGGDIVC